MVDTRKPGDAGDSPSIPSSALRERLHLALIALEEADDARLRAAVAVNTAKDHIEAILMRLAGDAGAQS